MQTEKRHSEPPAGHPLGVTTEVTMADIEKLANWAREREQLKAGSIYFNNYLATRVIQENSSVFLQILKKVRADHSLFESSLLEKLIYDQFKSTWALYGSAPGLVSIRLIAAGIVSMVIEKPGKQKPQNASNPIGRPKSTEARNKLVAEVIKELKCTPSDLRFWPTFEAWAEDKLVVPGRKGLDKCKWSKLSPNERERAHETVLRQYRDYVS
jgi:hypothetical protein